MRVRSISLENYRSYKHRTTLELGQVTVLIGSNNSGKSSIIRALSLLQTGSQQGAHDIRLGENSAHILYQVENVPLSWTGSPEAGELSVALATSADRTSLSFSMSLRQPHHQTGVNQFQAIAPNHYIVPFLAKRKVGGFSEDVRAQYANQITDNFTFLGARLSVISNQYHPKNPDYASACKDILGFVVTSVPSANGQQPGIYVPPNGDILPLSQLGEGVPNIVSLLVELATSQGKLFLIEEPENDLHPAALKALLRLIEKSAGSNQFVISTHSNIVLSYLGSSSQASVYEITSEPGQLPPISHAKAVEPTAAARLDVLRSMGYALTDFDLWEGWLFLEESSAERVLRDLLIPWFVPSLSGLRTFAAGGVSNVEPALQDFHRLVLFTHLETLYRGRTWVRLDGDEVGRSTVNQLRQKFGDWAPDRFSVFQQAAFERYYPSRFEQEANAALSIQDRQLKRRAKSDLLNKVLTWARENPKDARSEFEASALEVIDEMRRIAAALGH